jgi:hypothetical protein
VEHARAKARQRYYDYLVPVLDFHKAAEPDELADVVLDALTLWRHLDTGERCRCGCHPRLPDADLHEYGFGCPCRQTQQQRHRAFKDMRSGIKAFWDSPEGKQIRARQYAAEAELQAWLATQPGVVVRSHGGLAPEQWRGEVDGHTFYFRERHGEWRIEIDLRPRGHFARAVVGTGADGEHRFEERELDGGEVIAQGITDVESYGAIPLERAMFIVDTIRIHLARVACDLHTQDLSSIGILLGCEVRWCPSCGTRLSIG